MKKALVILSFMLFSGLLPETLHAQKLNIWKGGHAGRPSDWNSPRNWSLGIVPDQSCVAVIGADYRNEAVYPVISSGVEMVHYILVLTGARLEIRPLGRLEAQVPEACLFEGVLINRGQFIMGPDAYAHFQTASK